jgi:hypothetical protein
VTTNDVDSPPRPSQRASVSTAGASASTPSRNRHRSRPPLGVQRSISDVRIHRNKDRSKSPVRWGRSSPSDARIKRDRSRSPVRHNRDRTSATSSDTPGRRESNSSRRRTIVSLSDEDIVVDGNTILVGGRDVSSLFWEEQDEIRNNAWFWRQTRTNHVYCECTVGVKLATVFS